MGVIKAVGNAGCGMDRQRQGEPLSLGTQLPHGPGQIAPVNVLHGDVVVVLDPSQVEDLHDIRVREQGRDLGLQNKHLNKSPGLGEARENPLDDQPLLKPLHTEGAGQVHLGHAPQSDALEKLVVPKPARQLHAPASYRSPGAFGEGSHCNSTRLANETALSDSWASAPESFS